MSTEKIEQLKERDILEVMRELENSRASAAKDADTRADGAKPSAPVSPDPSDLLASLKKKRDLMGLLDGYSEAKGIVEKRQELEDAISFLEKLNLNMSDE